MRLDSVLFSGSEPIPEAEARSLAILSTIDDSLRSHLTQQWATLKQGLIVGAGVCVLGVALLLSGSTIFGMSGLLLGLAVAGGTYHLVDSREPSVRVTGMEKGYWTGYAVPTTDGTMVLDATQTVRDQAFQVDLIPDAARAHESMETLSSFDQFPVVLSDERDVERALLETLDEVDRAIEEAETHEIEAPVVTDSEAATDSLSWLLPRATAEPVEAGGVSLSFADASEQVESLAEFEEMVDEDSSDSVLMDVSSQSRELANTVTGLQEDAVDLLNDHIGTAGDYFGLVSYHFYCKDCIQDDIESRLESRGGRWYCETCRSRFKQGDGIPRHRIRDDLVIDMTKNLWIEKDDQLREIYENIEDQKSELTEREFEQQREEIRTTDERVKDIRARIRDLQTEAKAKRGAIDRIGDMMVKYDRLAEQKQAQFEEDVEEAFDEIDRRTREAIEETKQVVEGRIEAAEQEAKEKAELMREEERAFEREKLAFEQAMENRRLAVEQSMENERLAHAEQRADRRKMADLDQRERHHRKDILLETEGKISPSKTINTMRYGKGKLLGRSKYEG